MKKSLYLLAKTFVFVVASFACGKVSASHIMGSDITYTCLGNNQYQISVTVYRDCSGISMSNSIIVDAISTCGTQNVTLTQNPALSGVNVSQLCPGALSTCNGGSLPGVQAYVYQGTVTLQPNCGVYSFTYEECCRNPSNNIVNATSQGFGVTSTLNSNAATCNSAPQFTSLPVPYFCVNQQVNYSHGAIDVDGDSLVYSLVNPLNDVGGTVPFVGGFTATNPLPTAGGFGFDSQTGQMTFTPTTQGVYVVDVLVSEYRNGVLIGTTMRDIQIVIINCTNASPVVSNCLTPQNVSGGVIVDCNSLGVCPGQNVTFTLGARDPNGQPITVTSNIAQSIPGASLTTVQAGSPDTVTVTFNWTPAGNDTGFRYFTIQFEDNACPIPGLQIYTYDISVLDGTDAGPDRFYCTGGGPVSINVFGGNTFTWTPTTDIISTNANGSVIQVTPSVTTTYIVQSDLLGGCKNRDTVTVFNVQTFTTATSAVDDTICLNSSTDISVVGTPSSQGPFTYSWAPVANGGINAPTAQTTEVRPTTTTTYLVTVTSAAGCPVRDSVRVVIQGVGPKIVVNPSANNVCPGDQVTLNSLVRALECGPVANPLDPCLPGSSFSLQTVGTGTGSTGANTSPYLGFWMDGRVQYLYRASELQALGLSAGTITDIAFNVLTKGSTAPYNSFTIKMGCTSLIQLPTTFVGGLSTVVNPNAYTTTVGLNTHTLDVPYSWDGFSNLIIEVCYDNSAFTQYDNVQFTATAFPSSVLGQQGDQSTASGCTVFNTPTASADRPNTTFIMCVAPLGNYTFTWTGSDGSTLPNTPNPIVTVNQNVTYTVQITDGTCDGDTSVQLFINPATIINAGNDTVICGSGAAQLGAFLPNPQVPVCAPTYALTPITYAPIAATGPTTNGPSGDDVVSAALPIGFNFDYFCNAVTTFNISTNGWITFTPTTLTALTSQSLPSATAPNNVVALCWEDLLSNAGVITHYTVGTAPNRVRVIRFNNAGFFGTSGNVSGQIQLYETTNIIEIHIASQTATGQNSTSGIENATGTVGYAPTGFNQGAWTVPASAPVAFRYTPQTSGIGLTGVVWSPATGLSSTTILNPLATPSVTTDYVVQATFSNGCVNRDTVRVSLGNFPYSVSVSPDSICAGGSAQLNFNGAGVTFNWTPTNGLSSATAQNPTASPSVSTTYFVTAQDSLGCVAQDSLRVTVRTSPVITLGPDQNVCPYDSVTLSPSGGPYTSYSWSTGAVTPTITTSAQNLPNQNYWVTINDGNCFYNSDTVTINEFVLNPIVVNPSGDTAVCAGESIVLGADPGYVSYNWSNGGGNTQTITVSTAGVYTYTATDVNGCVLVAQVPANVIVAQRPAANIISSDDTICAGQTNSILSVTPVQGIVYTWLPNGTTGNTLPVDASGTYILIASDNGCTSRDTITILETIAPVINLGPDADYCACDSSITIDAGVAGTYVWSNGTTTTQTLAVTASGTYAVTVTDFNQCTAADNITLDIRCLTVDAVVADPPSGTVFLGQNAGLNSLTSYNNAGFSYSWTPSTFLDDSSKQSPSVQAPQITTTYYVTVVDLDKGCVAIDSVRLTVVPPGIPPMPNAFSPNGDGSNDTYGPFIPTALQGVYTVTEMRIYNRWGQMVYNGTANWDGTFNGAVQQVDTYIYYITLTGPDQSNPNVNIPYDLQGSFTLLH